MATSSTPAPAAQALMVTIRNAVATMPPAERRLADCLLTDPEGFARRSINEVADWAHTSTTTVVRFYKRIGYSRYKDLRHDLTQESLRARLAVREMPAEASDVARDDTLDQVVAKVARDETLSIGDTAKVLDAQTLADAVDILTNAARIDIFGIGGSAVVGIDLQRKLSRIGRAAIDWPDSHTAWTAAATLGTDAAALAISHSGATTDTIEFLRLARTGGAATIAITNAERSPITQEADVVLRTAARETTFRSGALGSRIAQLMVVDCLFIGVVQADYDSSVQAIRTTYDAVQSRATVRRDSLRPSP
ncbi:MurR/RpiR family transcriptional regulator [Ruania alba]|uniref:DNA-binding transcriptional regulator, MurR/RpiR family, contains HTH and SIS domains n=1 Tax=Ruania alba TaxID=648782 RepID=A0A1H5L6I5_9MICO|nr:MurR/RpiR family transcriptional regulator [Ruania alba]SEE71818.1 DNA-binding transcriptional regulator, MurR/RpiR family, contains HTH and SIS domains [Ruania alba]